MTCQTIKSKWKNKFPFLGFTQGRWLIKGQDDVCSLSFVRTVGQNLQHSCWCCIQACVLFNEPPSPPFAIHGSQAIPLLLRCSGLVCEGTDRQLLTVSCFPPTWGPSILCNLPVNHWGLQTAQQAPVCESSWCFRHYGLTLHSANC